MPSSNKLCHGPSRYEHHEPAGELLDYVAPTCPIPTLACAALSFVSVIVPCIQECCNKPLVAYTCHVNVVTASPLTSRKCGFSLPNTHPRKPERARRRSIGIEDKEIGLSFPDGVGKYVRLTKGS